MLAGVGASHVTFSPSGCQSLSPSRQEYHCTSTSPFGNFPLSGVYTAESLSSSPRSASLTLAAAVQVPTLGVGSVLIRSPSLYCAVAIVLFALRESAVLTYRPS